MSRGARCRLSSIDWSALYEEALAVQARAYAPYSRFQVGAALLGADGNLYRGCNVENVSYGLALCAERNAVAQAVAAGTLSFVALVVVTPADRPVAPCGMCRQVLAEFAPSFPIRSYGRDGHLHTSVAELLPHRFLSDDLGE